MHTVADKLGLGPSVSPDLISLCFSYEKHEIKSKPLTKLQHIF
jgi:hypothetical protein